MITQPILPQASVSLLHPRTVTPYLKPGVKHTSDIAADGESTFIFYSSTDDDVLKVLIEFSVTQDYGSVPLDVEFDRNLKKGLPVIASFWSGKATAGVGQQVPLSRDHYDAGQG